MRNRSVCDFRVTSIGELEIFNEEKNMIELFETKEKLNRISGNDMNDFS